MFPYFLRHLPPNAAIAENWIAESNNQGFHGMEIRLTLPIRSHCMNFHYLLPGL
jgi:hypothetical protein